MPDAVTTIRISKELRDDLAKLGSKMDTYDTIIRRLFEGKGADR